MFSLIEIMVTEQMFVHIPGAKAFLGDHLLMAPDIGKDACLEKEWTSASSSG
jgi:hypothetical protein